MKTKTPTQSQLVAVYNAALKMREKADALANRWCKQNGWGPEGAPYDPTDRLVQIAGEFDAVIGSLEMALQEINELIEQGGSG